MGFLSSLFGNPPALESQLVSEYASAFQLNGSSPQEAIATASEMVRQAKEVVVQRGWSNQPPNYGDLLLQHEGGNPTVRDALKAIRDDGVRDQDIRWWWNMNPLERVMIEKGDELNRMVPFIEALRQGTTAEEAAKKSFRIHPKFGDPNDGVGEDRPLPIELRRRITEFLERSFQPHLINAYQKKISQATSFNAIIRAEIRAGTL